MPGQEQSAESSSSEGTESSSESGSEGGLEGVDMDDIGIEDSDMADADLGDMGDSGEMAGGSDALPSLDDEELLDMSLEDFEESMQDAAEQAAAESQGQGQDSSSGSQGQDSQGQGNQGQGNQGVAGSEGAGAPGGGFPQGSGTQGGGFPQSTGSGGFPPGTGSQGYPSQGSGTMTTAEQVAILDAQLEQSTGDFDDLILQERDVIRRTAKDGGGEEINVPESAGGGNSGYGDYGEAPPMRGSGSGQSGAGPIPRSGGDQGDFPAQAAVYPPPEDIPSGSDDDVVARQLREAAMRETDPKLREKLWDEYRKYKGIDQ
jgi:hypothetical protein